LSDHFSTTKAFVAHDHRTCVRSALEQADGVIDARGLRMTPVRRRTLEILLERHGALGAYEILERLSADGFGHQPPVAYRALDFLVENGLAHRIRRLNAFAACQHPGQEHHAAFLICRLCNAVAEIAADKLRAALIASSAATGFDLERTSIEALGLCPACIESAPA
tara:strand:- start:171 stop:668 length:498 start_codon:yes stop_codon:yes gene_type:complete